MQKQFENNNTFFDLNIGEEENFATLYCVLGGANKKRAKMNQIALAYLKKEDLTEEEKQIAKKILDGSIYQDKKKAYDHCQLCSEKFVAEILKTVSDHYEHWELCCPTHPYTPGGLMIYLKNRKQSHIENVQDLSPEQFCEMEAIIKDVYQSLKDGLGEEGQVVGINVLFNQISKSQLCIHGHLEMMLKDVDNMGLGCQLKEERPYDVLTQMLNEQLIDRDGLYKQKEGIRMDLSKIPYQEALHLLGKYEDKIQQIIQHGIKLRNKELTPQGKMDDMLIHQMSPAPVNYVYLTYYRDTLFLSSVPEITLSPIQIDEIKGEIDLYSLKINQYAMQEEDRLLRQYSPMVRPSIKVSNTNEEQEKVKQLKDTVKEVLERSAGNER